MSVLLRSQSNLTLYIERGIDPTDAEVLEALDHATQHMLCDGAIKCDVQLRPAEAVRRRRLSERVLRNDSVVGVAVERARLAEVVVHATADPALLLRQGLLQTSIAQHASQVHLGPSYFILLGATVTITELGAPASRVGASARSSMLSALGDVATLRELVASSLGIPPAVVKVSLPAAPPPRVPLLTPQDLYPSGNVQHIGDPRFGASEFVLLT